MQTLGNALVKCWAVLADARDIEESLQLTQIERLTKEVGAEKLPACLFRSPPLVGAWPE